MTSCFFGLVNAAVSIAFFFAPYVSPLYQLVFRVTTYATSMPFIAGTCFIYTIISIILVVLHRKKHGSVDVVGPGIEAEPPAEG